MIRRQLRLTSNKGKMKSIFLFYLATLVYLCGFGQLKAVDKGIVIDKGKSVLYSKDANNLVLIQSTSDSIQNYIFKTSQGSLQNLDSGIVNGLFWLTDLEIGKVTLSVFKKEAGGLTMKNYKVYKVIEKPLTDDQKRIKNLKIQPILSIQGYVRGKIPLNVLQNAEGFTINKPYKVKNILLYLSSGKTWSEPMSYTLQSEQFDEQFKKQYVGRTGVGAIISIVNIEIADDKGNNYRLDERGFVVTE